MTTKPKNEKPLALTYSSQFSESVLYARIVDATKVQYKGLKNISASAVKK